MFHNLKPATPNPYCDCRLPESVAIFSAEGTLHEDPDIQTLIPGINTEGLVLAGSNYSIQREVGLNNQTTFAEILCRRIEFGIEDWPSLIRDQVVVDLCAGRTPYGYFLACVGEAKAYIGVEAYVADSLLRTLSNRDALAQQLYNYTQEYIAETGKAVKLIPKLVVAEDAASFIERIRDNSVSIFTVGMHSLLEREQSCRLKNSIPSALSRNGCLVAYPELICDCPELDFLYKKPIWTAHLKS